MKGVCFRKGFIVHQLIEEMELVNELNERRAYCQLDFVSEICFSILFAVAKHLKLAICECPSRTQLLKIPKLVEQIPDANEQN